ncbi:helix-turn-helix transcriptional regulator [Streptomyces sp. NPDC047002]|uniref:helix-turn-helix domain-containing protein n=1 Tax=Streptomyces sp. NPDC047002 TaxID=3155475 RepID=UPI003451FC4B
MPPSKLPPTIRQRRLGAELRRLREGAQLNVKAAAELHGTTQSRISNIESGGYPVGADRVRTLAYLYGCTDHHYIEGLVAMTGGRVKGWWEDYREVLPAPFLDVAELEHHASSMRIACGLHMPGLLQTPDHARALLRGVVPPYDPPKLEHLLSFRIKRQAVVYAERPTPVSCVIHEAALRMDVGGRAVAKAQLGHLLDMGEREGITIRVLPFGTGAYPSSGSGIVHFQAEVPELDSVHVDTDTFAGYVGAQPQLVMYRAVLDRLEEKALEPEESRGFVQALERHM